MKSFCKFHQIFSVVLLSAFLILSQSFAKESTRLLLVQTLFRHGDRSPLFLYPKDPNKLDSWPEGPGKLTQLGKKQHYAVGKFIRSIYKDFVTSNPNEVSAFSSESERCLSSVQAHLEGFNAPHGNWKVEELNWQSTPIYNHLIKYEKYLSFNSSLCPRVSVIHSKHFFLQTTEVFRKHQAILEAVSHYAGYNISQGINAYWLKDILTIEKVHNLAFPEWADTYWNELEEIEEIIFQSILNSSNLRLLIGPLLQKITETIIMKINKEATDLKIQLFCTHDINVGGVLLALNFTDIPRPPYCATLLFELHEMADATMAVRLLYLNSTDPLTDIGKPHVLVLDDCSEFCPIKIFTKKIQHLIPDNWVKECQFVTTDTCETGHTCENVYMDVWSLPKKDEL